MQHKLSRRDFISTLMTSFHASDDALETYASRFAEGGDVDERNDRGETPLLKLIKADDKDKLVLVIFLVSNGSDPTIKDNEKYACLHYCQNLTFAETLLKSDKSVVDELGGEYDRTPLFYAVWKQNDRDKLSDAGYLDMLRCFLEHGADPNVKDKDGNTPLHACQSKATTMLFLGKNAEIDEKNNKDWTPLFAAVRRQCARNKLDDSGYLDMLRCFMENGANPRTQDNLGRTPLHVCESKETAKLLLEKGAEIDARDNRSLTPLHFAVNLERMRNNLNASQYSDLLRCFLESGANPRVKNLDGNTALHFCGSKETANLLLEKGAEIDAKNNANETPLWVTVLNQSARNKCNDPGYSDMLRCFLENEANPKVKDDKGNTLLHVCESKETLNLLLEKGVGIDARNNHNQTPFFVAVLKQNVRNKCDDPGYSDMLRCFVENGADPRVKGNENETLFHVCQCKETALLLLKNGLAIDAKNNYDGTPLLTAVWEQSARNKLKDAGYLNMLRFFIESGADPRVKDQDGATPLHLCQSKATALLLLEKGAEIDAKNIHDQTPLFCAVSNRSLHNEINRLEYTDMLHCFLEKGANPRFQTKDGVTALHLCQSKEIAMLLLTKGAEIDAKDVNAQTPLFVAVRDQSSRNNLLDAAEYSSMLCCFLESGANPRIKHNGGNTPLHVCEFKETAKLLLEKGAEIDEKNFNKQTPLFVAVFLQSNRNKLHDFEYSDMLSYFLEKGSNPSVQTIEGNTPLHVCESKKTAMLLFKKGAGIDVKNIAGFTPLHYAVKEQSNRNKLKDSDYLDMLCCFLENGADPRVKTFDGVTPLHACQSEETAALLLKYGAEIEATCKRNFHTPLYGAVADQVSRNKLNSSDYVDMIRFLLNQGARTDYLIFGKPRINLSQSQEVKNLWESHVREQKRIEKRLQTKSTEGKTSHHREVLEKRKKERKRILNRSMLFICETPEEAERILITSPLLMDSKTSNGETILFHVVAKNVEENKKNQNERCLELIRYWMQKGLNLNTPNKNGKTCLHVCRTLEIMKVLIENGATIDALDVLNQTPLWILIKETNEMNETSVWFSLYYDLIALLVSKNANVHHKKTMECTPMTLTKHEKIKKLLSSPNSGSINLSSTPSMKTSLSSIATRTLPFGKHYHYFAAHNWGESGENHSRMKKMVLNLRSKGYKVWFDDEPLTNDVVEQIEKGLNESEAMLCFVTEMYAKKVSEDGESNTKRSDWCAFGFNHALTTYGQSFMIPIVMESKMLMLNNWPSGTVRILLLNSLLIDYSKEENLENSVKSLLENQKNEE